MKCIVCDKCKEIIKNPRLVRVITCARPLRIPVGDCVAGKPEYRGNDRQQNDIFWEKEICDNCLGELEAFFESGGGATEPDNPNIPGDPDGGETGGEEPTEPIIPGGDGGEGGEGVETPAP